MKRERWLIWSNEHRAWWGPARQGYTQNIFKAGRYSGLEATEICNNANRHLKGDDLYEVAMLTADIQREIAQLFD